MQGCPVRGQLQLDYVRPGWYRGQRNPPLLAGLLVPGETRWALPPLDQARVVKIRGPHLLILGYEEIERDRRTLETFRQAWWCRLVEGSGTAEVEMADLASTLLERIKRQRRQPARQPEPATAAIS